MGVVEGDALLRANEHEPAPKFEQKLFDLSDECRFKIAF